MRFGFHVSIAGGFKNVVRRAVKTECETIQLFTRNPRGWRYRPLNKEDINIFKEEIAASCIWPVFVHLPYLINLASPRRTLYQRSVAALIKDLQRGAAIGASFLIMHVGSATDKTRGLESISNGINQAFDRVKNRIALLLENTAGSGHELGADFSQLSAIVDRISDSERIGICLDTAHAFAAGYDLRDPVQIARTLDAFDRTIGLRRLHLIHLNDTRAECGSHKDRHWHIGQGNIGKGMHHLLHQSALQHLPFIMETPRTGEKDDIENMKRVRRLLARRPIGSCRTKAHNL
jgi:deoxyribonuclease-4